MFDSENSLHLLPDVPAVTLLQSRIEGKVGKRQFRTEMKLVEQEQGRWYLLILRENFYLDVRCEMGPYRLYLLIMLDETEKKSYSSIGRSYINLLAATIRSSPPFFYDRVQPFEIQQMVRLVINNSYYGNRGVQA